MEKIARIPSDLLSAKSSPLRLKRSPLRLIALVPGITFQFMMEILLILQWLDQNFAESEHMLEQQYNRPEMQ